MQFSCLLIRCSKLTDLSTCALHFSADVDLDTKEEGYVAFD